MTVVDANILVAFAVADELSSAQNADVSVMKHTDHDQHITMLTVHCLFCVNYVKYGGGFL